MSYTDAHTVFKRGCFPSPSPGLEVDNSYAEPLKDGRKKKPKNTQVKSTVTIIVPVSQFIHTRKRQSMTHN